MVVRDQYFEQNAADAKLDRAAFDLLPLALSPNRDRERAARH